MKIKYANPRLIGLSDYSMANGACTPTGSSAFDCTSTGTVASSKCQSFGTIISSTCSMGDHAGSCGSGTGVGT